MSEKAIETKIGFCRYCGASMMVRADRGKTQAEWDDAATNDCMCKDAQNARWKQAVLEDFAEKMKGIDLSPKVRKYLEDGAELIADNVLGYIQIRTDQEETVRIYKKSAGIFLRKTTTNTEELLSDGMYRQ